MFEQRGIDLWEAGADLRLITTNGETRKDGACVMGCGCAREARDAIPGIDRKLGALLREHGNRPMRLCRYRGADLATFPVKHCWREQADPELIAERARLLLELVDRFGYQQVVLPRPGCGNGGRSWEAEVKPLLAEVLDERFLIVT